VRPWPAIWSAALWIVAPTAAAASEARAHGSAMTVPMGVVVFDSIGRTALLVFMVWFVINGVWAAVIIVGVLLGLLTAGRVLLSRWLISRAPSGTTRGGAS
jgi:hypothetical protein